MITVEQLWAEKYAALHEAALAVEADRRAEDFIEVPRTVCGLELRMMTPRDLLHLDYAKNPFVSGGEITEAKIAAFLWQMLDQQPRGYFGQRKFFRHIGNLIYAEAIVEIRAYLDRVFADSPKGAAERSGEKPISTSFVAPLIVHLASGIPGLTPQAIMDTPLPQLFQYRKVLRAEDAGRRGKTLRDFSPSDALLPQCLEEVNRINAAAAQISNPEISDAAPEAAAA